MLTLKRDAERYCDFNWCVSRTKLFSFGSVGNGGSQPGARIWVDRKGLKEKILLRERRGDANKQKSHPKLRAARGGRDGAGSHFVQPVGGHRAPPARDQPTSSLCGALLLLFNFFPSPSSSPLLSPSPRLALPHHVY